MARRKRRHGKPSMVRRVGKQIVQALGIAAGVFVATTPLQRGIKIAVAGDFQAGANAIAFDTAGLGFEGAKPDIGKIVQTGLTVGAGIGIMWLFKQLAKRV